MLLQVVASQDWPEVTKYAGLVCAQAYRQELIQDLYKTWHDPQRGTVTGGMIRYFSYTLSHTLNNTSSVEIMHKFTRDDREAQNNVCILIIRHHAR